MRESWIHRMRSLAIVGLLATTAFPAFADSYFAEELGADDAKLLDKVKFDFMSGSGDGSDSGRGPKPCLKALGAPPKRVALITFYVKDSGNSDKHPYAGWSIHKNVTANGVDLVANELYTPAIGPM